MTTEDEYRQFAEECMQWARAAESDAERKAFLDMARAWTDAAARMDGEAAPTGIIKRAQATPIRSFRSRPPQPNGRAAAGAIRERGRPRLGLLY